MKQALLAAFLWIVAAIPSHAILTQWYPEAKPYPRGRLGTGEYALVWKMRRYATPPQRPYRIIGRIDASGGIWGSPRTRAVEVAREHGADAILWARPDANHGEANSIGLIGLLSHCDYLAIQWVRSPK